MPTIRDVAKEAGVSVASASRALNGLSNVTEEMRQRVWAAAKKLHFVPHSGARSLTRRRSDAIGVILPDLFGEFFSEIVRGIDRAAHRAGLQLLLGNMHGSAHETIMAIRAMHGRVDGLVVMPSDVSMEALSSALPPDLPVVILNGPTEGLELSAVSIDNYAGAYQVTSALIAQGATRIAHIAGPKHNHDAIERLRGFCDAMAELADCQTPLVIAGDFSEEAGIEAAQLIVNGGVDVDAVFAANDMMAVGCMAALIERGVSIPDQISVAGFDDIPLARFVAPALSTMRVNMAQLGETAANMLIDQVLASANGKAVNAEMQTQTHMLVPELVLRQSTRSKDNNNDKIVREKGIGVLSADERRLS